MSEQIGVTTERVDDIPILTASMERIGIAELMDKCFIVHGNWQGLSVGKVMTGWLTHILSEADHRMNRVQDWARKRINTLSGCLGEEVRELDFADDRLAAGLDMMSDGEKWAEFERALNQRIIRVYDLKAKVVRIDTTTGSGYWKVTEDGLFEFGHSKDHRPDLRQIKVVMASLDPLAMPVVTQVVGGGRADDKLYIPAIDEVRAGMGQPGLLYVGDCKMMSLETRTHIAAGNDRYLGPFSLVQVPIEKLDEYLKPVWSQEQPLTEVTQEKSDGTTEKIAEGFECSLEMKAIHDGKEITWVERHLVVRSLRHAKAAELALQERLEKAQAALQYLNVRKHGKRRFTELEPLQQAAQAILARYDVEELLLLEYNERVRELPVRKYRDRPAGVRIERQVSVSVQRNETAILQSIRHLGWRVYGTNCPADDLSLEQAVLAYRQEYLIEHDFRRLKGKPLSLSPTYLQDDQRLAGLTNLLSIGLRILTLLEHVARVHLTQTGDTLAGLYPGNPTRSTNRPTTEAMLQAFKDIFINSISLGDQTYCHLTPLSDLQCKLLCLLNFPTNLYTRLAGHSFNST